MIHLKALLIGTGILVALFVGVLICLLVLVCFFWMITYHLEVIVLVLLAVLAYCLGRDTMEDRL